MVVLAIFLSSCKSNDDSKTEIKVSSIVLNQTSLDLKVGDTSNVWVEEILPENATNPDFAFYSEDEDVAAVEDGGLVTAVGVGTTNIVFKAVDGSGVTALCSVVVSEAEPVGPDYLLMCYGVGGKNLDEYELANIVQALNAGSSDKLKMTFQFKLSKRFQDDSKYENFNGTRRFTADENTSFKGKIAKGKLPDELTQVQLQAFCDSIISTKYADADCKMFSSWELSSFIKWSVEQYPETKKTILILTDHGGGWSLNSDGRIDYPSKAILFDDNTADFPMSAKTLREAIASSPLGKVTILYTDACQMGMMENYTTYAPIADYVIASVENAPGQGGEYMTLCEELKNTPTTDAGIEAFGKAYIDHLVNNWWSPNGYSDLGFFDMRKISSVISAFSLVASELKTKWNDKTPLDVSESAPFGNQWDAYIKYAAVRCVSAGSAPSVIKYNRIPNNLIPYLRDGNVTEYTDRGGFSGYSLLMWLITESESLDQAQQDVPNSVIYMQEYMEQRSNDNYSVVDMLRIVNATLKDAELPDNDNPFINLRDNLIAAFKTMGYINCTKKLQTIESDYDLCCPGVFMNSLNPSVFNADYKYFPRYNMNLDQAIAFYTSSEFDKATGWSEFLKLLDVSPSLLVNPLRSEVKEIPQ